MAHQQHDCPPERFIEVWQQSTSVEEVAKILEMPKQSVYTRAHRYRSLGIKLKRMHRGRPLDVEKLNKMIEGGQQKDNGPFAL